LRVKRENISSLLLESLSFYRRMICGTLTLSRKRIVSVGSYRLLKRGRRNESGKLDRRKC
jgi:hypothetical protein